MSEILATAFAAVRMYDETHPRPPQVTQQQAAEMLNISRHTVRKLIAHGDLSLNKCGMIPIGQIDKALTPFSKMRDKT